MVCGYLHRHQIEHENDQSGCTIAARAELEDVQISNDGVLGLESTFTSIPTVGTEEASLDSGFPTTVMLADKGKHVNPREYGCASSNPNPMILPVGVNSIGIPGVIEVIGVPLGKEKSVTPRKREDGRAKYEPGPSRIDFPDCSPHYDSASNAFQTQDIALQPLEPTKATDLNQESHYDPTSPRLRWHPKISPYRLMVFSIPLVIGTAKAVSSQKGNVTVPITLEWISGVVVFLVWVNHCSTNHILSKTWSSTPIFM